MAKQKIVSSLIEQQTCYHCGDTIGLSAYKLDEHVFCCLACQSVYTILSQHKLGNYYRYNTYPGKEIKKEQEPLFHYLDEDKIVTQLIDFQDDYKTIVTFYIPNIHCSSCVWLLENLHRLNNNVQDARADFLKKRLCVTFNHQQLTLKELAELLKDIGYAPLITLEDATKNVLKEKQQDLVAKIAVAGFCFGNAMMISFPEYFGLADFEQKYAQLFGYLNLAFTLPILLYSGRDYFTSAAKSIKQQVLNLDVPLALGIAVLFIRSFFDILSGSGPGFSDTLCGLVFFLLIGRWVQQRTYQQLSFERDYRSYFPIAVTCLEGSLEKTKTLVDLQIGDRIRIRSHEIIPADAILLKGEAAIDFSFVTGESTPVTKVLGEIIYAGGKQTKQAIELEVVKSVSQSYLTKLWNDQEHSGKAQGFYTFSQKISHYFTPVLLSLAIGAACYWFMQGQLQRAWDTFTAVLIIACPCALALSSPFTLASLMRLFDKQGFYLKNTETLEKMATIDTMVFDKTGTISNASLEKVTYEGILNAQEKQMVYQVCSNSNHPLSRLICQFLESGLTASSLKIEAFEELPGKGIAAWIADQQVLVGNAKLIKQVSKPESSTYVYISINGKPKAYFAFEQKWRKGLFALLNKVGLSYDLHLLSGDTDRDRLTLKGVFPRPEQLHFNQSPKDKLTYLADLQKKGKRVAMFGDGLNDAAALKQANLGIAITDNTNNFSPACDGILDGKALYKLPQFLTLAKQGMYIIYTCFAISILYNSIGLSLAVQGTLSPLFAAILMPLSTFTIIAFTSLATNFCGRILHQQSY